MSGHSLLERSSSLGGIELGTAFYDVVFGDVDRSGGLNELEQVVCSEIDVMLEGTKNLSDLVPTLPKQLIEITQALSSKSADFDVVMRLIREDVALAGEVLRAVNSPLFRRSTVPVESISKAVSILGLVNIANIVSTVLAQRVMSVAPIYFKLFGQKIWNHSLECAAACQSLFGTHDPCLCHFLGLIHDIGKIAIFPALVEGLKSVHPDIKPGGQLFKDRMTDYSLWLSWKIAEEWALPEPLVTALSLQRSRSKCTAQPGSLGELLYHANLCSEVHMLTAAGTISFDEGTLALQRSGVPDESIFTICAAIESVH